MGNLFIVFVLGFLAGAFGLAATMIYEYRRREL